MILAVSMSSFRTMMKILISYPFLPNQDDNIMMMYVKFLLMRKKKLLAVDMQNDDNLPVYSVCQNVSDGCRLNVTVFG